MRWALTAAFVATTVAGATGSSAETPTPAEAARVERTVRYALTLTNRSNERLQGAAVRVFAPAKQTSMQRAGVVTTSLPHEMLEDELGNRALRFRIDLAPQAVDTVSIEAMVEFTGSPAPVRIDDPAPWLEPGRYMEVEAPEIAQAARQVVGGTATELAASALAFVAGHVTSDGYVAEEHGALAALTSGTGDCTESMYLFVTLLRARGVPARGVSGFVLRGNTTLRAAGLHDWAEYHDGTTWQVADPYRRMLHPQEEDYLAMLILDGDASPLLGGMRRFTADAAALDVRME